MMTRIMVLSSVIWIVFFSATFSSVYGAPKSTQEKENSDGEEHSKGNIGQLGVIDYQDFQISDGKAGNSSHRALEVFLEPFMRTRNLSIFVLTGDIPSEVKAAYAKADEASLQHCNKMQETASRKEEEFNQALKKASKKTKEGIQASKIANKVLKITAQVSCILMELTHDNKRRAAKLPLEQKKLTKNIKLDLANGKHGLEMTPLKSLSHKKSSKSRA